MTERMKFVGGSGGAAKGDAEKNFVRRVGQGVRRFREKGRRSGHQSADQLRDGDDHIRRQRYQNRSPALIPLNPAQRRARSAIGRAEHECKSCSMTVAHGAEAPDCE